MKILSAIFFLCIGLGIGTVLSTASARWVGPNGGGVPQAAEAGAAISTRMPLSTELHPQAQQQPEVSG